MIHTPRLGFDPERPDAVFDLDGTVFKFTVLEQYVGRLCDQGIFAPLPAEIEDARLTWKSQENNETNYKDHSNKLVEFFVAQVAGQSAETLQEVAEGVAADTAYRQWDITRNIINTLRPTHNVLAISLMPEWLIPPFTKDLGFVATLGSTYVTRDGIFTGEAYSIDKAQVYSDYRDGDTSQLDVAMGDTVGDLSMLRLADRPIAFNPSFTLAGAVGDTVTMVSAQKDLVTVKNRYHPDRPMHAEDFHCSQASKVLALVRSRNS